jgi:hypothetical protein
MGDLIRGGITVLLNYPPQERPLLLQGYFVMSEWVAFTRGGTTVLLNHPPQESHSSYKATFSCQNGWPYKRRDYCTTKLSPSREATPLIRLLFHVSLGLFKRGHHSYMALFFI